MSDTEMVWIVSEDDLASCSNVFKTSAQACDWAMKYYELDEIPGTWKSWCGIGVPFRSYEYRSDVTSDLKKELYKEQQVA